MKATLAGYTVATEHVYDALNPLKFEDTMPRPADLLAEFAGRLCYLSFHKPNPKTRLNRPYLDHIIELQHNSVLEHASVSFKVEGVSRHLLGELTRHRHASYSVESLRYCPPRTFAIHPTVAEHPELEQNMAEWWDLALERYNEVYDFLTRRKVPLKQARETAAQWLPLSTDTSLVITANLSAWRYILARRLDPSANREIRKLAEVVLEALKEYAPATFQDMEVAA
ncbi:FAD-dependent thymidylate synthase [Microbispora sp. NPDC049633]|uniref:FAD-dependent thymidylate synthase n=1 Tax=Microbispora sp. NPDC049633 TaxID=3154355 RepID=UPI0034411942